MMRFLALVSLFAVIGQLAVVQSFAPSAIASRVGMKGRAVSALFMSDVPKDETDETLPAKTKKRRNQWIRDSHQQLRNWKDNSLPEAPEDQLTLSGDIASLFLYAFMDHFLNDVYLASILASSTSAADAANSLDPSGSQIVLSSNPVWLDLTAVGPHVSDQVLFWDLQSRVMPHFTPLLSSAGIASVSLASCWILAGLLHKAFHFRNTLDCSTHRAVAVTGQTWVTASILLILLTTASQHWMMDCATDVTSTMYLMMEGRTITPLEEWFSVLTRADAEFIFNSLGVLLTWRFLVSFLLGGWFKK